MTPHHAVVTGQACNDRFAHQAVVTGQACNDRSGVARG